MKSITLILILLLVFVAGIFTGIGSYIGVEEYLMGDYDLYNCIYNNAADNGFTDNPFLIRKIQDECVCFRDNDYVDLLDAGCGGIQEDVMEKEAVIRTRDRCVGYCNLSYPGSCMEECEIIDVGVEK